MDLVIGCCGVPLALLLAFLILAVIQGRLRVRRSGWQVTLTVDDPKRDALD